MTSRAAILISTLIASAVAWIPSKLAAQERNELSISDFKVGAKGYPDGGPETTDVKIVQIVDGNQMLIRIRDRRTLKSELLLMLKFPTKGLIDGTSYGVWAGLIGKDRMIKVSDTVTYKTAGGGSNTVFVVEVVQPDEKELAANRLKEEERKKAEAAAQLKRQQEADKRKAEAEAKRKADEAAKKKADQQSAEKLAASLLKYAKEFVDSGMVEKAKEPLQGIVASFPNTDAAKTAKELLDSLGK